MIVTTCRWPRSDDGRPMERICLRTGSWYRRRRSQNGWWRPIRGLAYHRDLYTVFAGGQELDDFERWLSSEYEQPGLEAIDRVLCGSRLTPEDWRSMARLVAAQDIRTPLSFIESVRRWDQEVPEVLDRTIRESINRLEEAKEQGACCSSRNQSETNSPTYLRSPSSRQLFRASDQATVRAEIPAGRRLWIAAMRHLLTGVADTLCRHRWSVAEPAGDAEWPLTDHPALRLNYYKAGHYDLAAAGGIAAQRS